MTTFPFKAKYKTDAHGAEEDAIVLQMAGIDQYDSYLLAYSFSNERMLVRKVSAFIPSPSTVYAWKSVEE